MYRESFLEGREYLDVKRENVVPAGECLLMINYKIVYAWHNNAVSALRKP
jgi:hypothetical protein